MLRRGEDIYDLPGLLEALYWEPGPGGDRGVNSIVVESCHGEDPQVCIRFNLEGSTSPNEIVPFNRTLLVEAFERGYVELVGWNLYRITLKGRHERNRGG